MRLRYACFAQAVIEPVEMFIEAKTTAAKNRDDFVDAIAEQEAAIHHGNVGRFQRQQLPIQINRCHWPGRVRAIMRDYLLRNCVNSNTIQSQKRLKMPPRSTFSRAISGVRAISLPSSVTMTSPMTCCALIGAFKYLSTFITAWMASPRPRGMVSVTSLATPTGTASLAPLQTRVFASSVLA